MEGTQFNCLLEKAQIGAKTSPKNCAFRDLHLKIDFDLKLIL